MHNKGWSAPEQFTNQVIETPATDVFSAALSIYFARTGKHAWGTSHPELYPTNVLTKAPNLSGFSQDLQLWLQPAFAKDPKNRPSAQKLLDELEGKVEDLVFADGEVLNPKTWAEFETIALRLLEGLVEFRLHVHTSNFGSWHFESSVDIDEAFLYLYSGDDPQRALTPNQRKQLFSADWKSDSLGTQRLVFNLEDRSMDIEFIGKLIRNTLSNGLAVSIENVSVSLRD
jgi:serine/threonine protein kinase